MWWTVVTNVGWTFALVLLIQTTESDRSEHAVGRILRPDTEEKAAVVDA